MRGAYGKPQGLVARVDIGDFLFSVRLRDQVRYLMLHASDASDLDVFIQHDRCSYFSLQHVDSAIEAFRRAKFKFPGRQFVVVSRKWGFTKWDKADYEKMRAEGRLAYDGVNVQHVREHGPLTKWIKNPI